MANHVRETDHRKHCPNAASGDWCPDAIIQRGGRFWVRFLCDDGACRATLLVDAEAMAAGATRPAKEGWQSASGLRRIHCGRCGESDHNARTCARRDPLGAS